MNANHTPGPWFVIRTHTGALSIDKTTQVPIATVGGAGWHLGRETAEANAALISAAPELLDLLARALPFVETAETDIAYKTNLVFTLATEIRAAIVKAEGKI